MKSPRMREPQVVGMSWVVMLSLRATGMAPVESRFTCRKVFSVPLCVSIARNDASAYSRGEIWVRASVNGRSRMLVI